MKITILRNAIKGIPGDLANDVGKHALLDYALGTQRYTQQGNTVVRGTNVLWVWRCFLSAGGYLQQLKKTKCCISALALFADGEDGKFTVSSKLSTALVELTSSDVAQPYKTLQSVTDIKVDITTPPHQSKSTIVIGEVRVCLRWLCMSRLYRLLLADKESRGPKEE